MTQKRKKQYAIKVSEKNYKELNKRMAKKLSKDPGKRITPNDIISELLRGKK